MDADVLGPSLIETIGTALRAQLIYSWDLFLNGAFIVFVSYIGLVAVEDKRTMNDVLFALDRNKVAAVWDELTWSDYVIACLAYAIVFWIGVIAFFVDTRILLTWIGYASPLVLTVATLLFSFGGPNLYVLHGDGGGISTDYRTLWLYLYRLLLRGAYGYGVSRFYMAWRWPPYGGTGPNDGILFGSSPYVLQWILRYPFFIPLMRTFCNGYQIPAAMMWALFTPLLVNELYFFFYFLRQYIVPYYLIGRLTILRVIERPDILHLQALIIRQWTRLRITMIFRSFFFARVAIQLIYVFYVIYVIGPENDPYQVFARRRLTNDWLWTGGVIVTDDSSATGSNELMTDSTYSMTVAAFEYLMARSCETLPSMIAFSSIVALVGTCAGYFFTWILFGGRNGDGGDEELIEEQEGLGSLTGALFFVLCLQTGLSLLSAEMRLCKLYRNLWLLSMAILHFVHHTVNSTMIRLCTRGRFGWQKHLRAVLVGGFILLAPCVFFKLCWKHTHWANPWLISVALFAVELAVKTATTFVTYVFLLLDVVYPRLRAEDTLYVIQTIGAALDFFFGVCLLFNGIWILLYEQGGVLRTVMICIHGYFNIYQRAKRGLTQLRRRRLASQKLNSLTNASSSRLREAGDEVCPICYEEFNSGNEIDPSEIDDSATVSDVKVTACGHLLHSACLMKWLYVRDTCPLCHQIMFQDTSLAEEDIVQDDDQQ